MKRGPCGKHQVGEDAETINISTLVDALFATRLFGRHKGGDTRRVVKRIRRWQQLGQTEIGHFDPAIYHKE